MDVNPWPGRSASVVLLPSGILGAELFEQARAWARAGLIGPAFWVRPEDVQTGTGVSLSLPAEVLGHINSQRVDVLQQLALNVFSRINLVAVRVAQSSPTIDDVQEPVVKAVFEVMEKVVPQKPGATPTPDFPTLISINMVAVPPWLGDIDATSAVRTSWKWNLLVAMEDRISPFGTDAIIRSNSRVIGAVLANIASAAGLWSGVPTSSVKLLNPDASNNANSVWFHRTFARGVIHKGLLSAASVDALKFAGNPEMDLFDPIEGMQPSDLHPVEPEQRDRLIEVFVNRTLTLGGGVLVYKESRGYQPPSRVDIGFRQQIIEFFRFSWDKIKLLPILVAKAIVDAFSGQMTKVFQGSSGRKRIDAQIDIKPLRQDKRDLQLFAEIQALMNEREILVEGPVTHLANVPQAPPELWGDFRKIVFAALDGSQPPVGVTLPHNKEKKVPVVLRRVSDLTFDPGDRWDWDDSQFPIPEPAPAVTVVDIESLAEAHAIRETLATTRAELEAELLRLQSPPPPKNEATEALEVAEAEVEGADV